MWVKNNKRKKEEERKKNVIGNNGPFCFHGSRQDQKPVTTVSDNNYQLCLQLPQQVAQASRLDRK